MGGSLTGTRLLSRPQALRHPHQALRGLAQSPECSRHMGHPHGVPRTTQQKPGQHQTLSPARPDASGNAALAIFLYAQRPEPLIRRQRLTTSQTPSGCPEAPLGTGAMHHTGQEVRAGERLPAGAAQLGVRGKPALRNCSQTGASHPWEQAGAPPCPVGTLTPHLIPPQPVYSEAETASLRDTFQNFPLLPLILEMEPHQQGLFFM